MKLTLERNARVVRKRNRWNDSSLIDPYVPRAYVHDFEDEIFPSAGITFKKAPVYDAGRPCWIRRGKAAIRLAFLTVSDGCWLYIYFLFAARARIDSVYPIAIFSVYTASRERYAAAVSPSRQWLRRLLHTDIHSHISEFPVLTLFRNFLNVFTGRF